MAVSNVTEAVIVTDSNHYRVQLFSSNGKLIKEYDFEKHNDKPTSVTFTVFNNDGDFFYDIGSKRSSDEQTKKLY